MPKRNRSTLKNYFRQGMMPSAEHFGDLIDSCVNEVDEGFSKPPASGLQLTALDQQHLLSFYQKSQPNTPLWHVRFTNQSATAHAPHLSMPAHDTAEPSRPALNPPLNTFSPPKDNGDQPGVSPQAGLQFVAGEGETIRPHVTFTATGQVGIQTETPQHTLDVRGTIASRSRQGYQPVSDAIPADGEWHDITGRLEGCQMFEVVAGIGIRHSGRYALLHAIATNTCAPVHWWWQFWRRKNPIKTQHAYFGSMADRLALRWKQTTEQGAIRPYVLQIRTNTSYGANQFIRYHLTQLWDDAYMVRCENKPQTTQDS
ncbi:hypothetical protein VA7868_01488 [Vibrio aerogenes CECT 7868]|uniref:Uncharacterized protein n=1 Tax=Vibrio aerogenes CECT 7868 TaxID=1216006 RepID=A0A1M5Y4U0_9VIBR|nr:hypothetical protein [Vibrio aerogenes]SHI06949.1 hypothetical protein VA7868_01488 [Vibrio aerogenes CECT 7868]